MNKRWPTYIMMLAVSGVAWAQVPSSAPTSQYSGNPDDDMEAVVIEEPIATTNPATMASTTQPGSTTRPGYAGNNGYRGPTTQRTVYRRRTAGGNNGYGNNGYNNNNRNFAGSRPADATSGTPEMTSDLSILQNRSIFIKGRQYDTGGRGFNERGNNDFAPPVRSEPMPIFTGAGDANGTIVGVLEDSMGNVQRIKVGDLLRQGRVTKITLDSMEYETGGRTVHVALGQDLSGMGGSDSSYSGYSSSSSSTSTSTSSTTQPSGPANSVLERLRQRRLQETGG